MPPLTMVGSNQLVRNTTLYLAVSSRFPYRTHLPLMTAQPDAVDSPLSHSGRSPGNALPPVPIMMLEAYMLN